LYGCVVGTKDHIVGKDGSPFDAKHFRENPHLYTSIFYKKVCILID
jgi:hypothetical protein